MKKSYTGPVLIVGGGLAAIGVVWLARRKSTATTEDISKILSGETTADSSDNVKRGVFNARLTGYWPFTAGTGEKKMEGGTKDRRGNPLYTLEMHINGMAPYVSVAGDDVIWPYGQRIKLDAWPNAIFRVVDTGGHFRGAGKLYRVLGHEPLDICVDSSKTVVPKLAVGQIVPGDNFAKGKAVATSGFKAQDVVVGDAAIVEGRTEADAEALARAIESEIGNRSLEEMRAAAWAIRNRADDHGLSVCQLLAPSGEWGSPRASGGYASTRRAPTERARTIANEVLALPPQADPTDGAIDFWLPASQARMSRHYVGYGSETKVRAQQDRAGLVPVAVIGAVELLARRPVS